MHTPHSLKEKMKHLNTQDAPHSINSKQFHPFLTVQEMAQFICQSRKHFTHLSANPLSGNTLY